MKNQVKADPVLVKYFEWSDWDAMWQLRVAQLAEHGIIIDPKDISSAPVDSKPGSYEWDLNHIDTVYLDGAGGFWLAWLHDQPVGQVGAQDLGGGIELRRMYVKAEFRRRGIGYQLVATLIKHCIAQGAQAIELWTNEDGPGRFLYEKHSFYEVNGKGNGFESVVDKPDEIRMRLALSDFVV